MTLKIRRAAVLGAGVMGAQIAAHLAAAGVRTYLLDLPNTEPPKDPKQAQAVGKNFRSARAILAIEQLKTLKPSPLTSVSVLPNIIPGNFEDDWSVLAEADWIIEAVVERLDIKRSIHKRISEVARQEVPVTTNTSGISLKDIAAELPEHYQQKFFGTHFFNPPRYMKLLEVIPHERTHPKLFDEVSEWIASRLGKGIVVANDTINFIGNRVGVLAIQATIKHMEDLKLNIATVDTLTGPLTGRPKSATFRTIDVVGLDTYAHVANNVTLNVKSDPLYEYFAISPWLKDLINKGHLGQKTPTGGCYQKSKNAKGETTFLCYDYEKETYIEQESDNIPWLKEASGIRDLYSRFTFIFNQKDKYAELVWRVQRDIFSYAAMLLESIAKGEPKSVDEAMVWGFNYEAGPFQVWQACGYDVIRERMQKEGAKLPKWCEKGLSFYEPAPQSTQWMLTGPVQQLTVPGNEKKKIKPKPHHFHLPTFANKEDRRIVAGNKSASLVDIGDGVACFTLHSKMNTLNDEIFDIMLKTVGLVNQNFEAMIFANEGEHFSAGANLATVLEAIEKKDFAYIDKIIRNFQGANQLFKFASFPTVSAPHGLVLGGGCEVSLHTSRTLLANDTFAGLVEVGVGLIPGGGGTKELALRAYDTAALGDGGDAMPFLRRAFSLIGMAKVSTSGLEAIEMGLYPKTAGVSISRDHQILRAKEQALELVRAGYAAPVPKQDIAVVGDPGIQTFKLMLYNMIEGRMISEHDAFVGEQVATILCGGAVDAGSRVSEQYFLDLERNAFIYLCQQSKTKDRIVHMLKTGKPLRN